MKQSEAEKRFNDSLNCRSLEIPQCKAKLDITDPFGDARKTRMLCCVLNVGHLGKHLGRDTRNILEWKEWV